MSDAVLVLIDNTNLESFHTAIQILEDVTNAKKPNQSDPNGEDSFTLNSLVCKRCFGRFIDMHEHLLAVSFAL